MSKLNIHAYRTFTLYWMVLFLAHRVTLCMPIHDCFEALLLVILFRRFLKGKNEETFYKIQMNDPMLLWGSSEQTMINWKIIMTNSKDKVRISLGTSSLLERQDRYYSTTATRGDYSPYTHFMIFNTLRDDFPTP
jgi:hypothetical protein